MDKELETLLSEQRHELKAAKALESDLDFAFQLQFQEAINASLSLHPHPSSSSSNTHLPNDDVPSPGLAHLLDEEIAKFELEYHDCQQAQTEMIKLRNDLSHGIHDHAFPRELLNIPEKQWAKTGDYIHKPFGEGSSIRSITMLSKRKLSVCSETGPVGGDIEDTHSLSFSSSASASGADFINKQKKNRLTHSLLHRFRTKRALSVTDITGTEWCEKQKEFFLRFGKPKATRAMEAGSARHAVLEEEVVKRVKLRIESDEDSWAIKLINFIVGANQLLFDGLTRELPLIGFAEGVWMVGVIDEIRMPLIETVKNPTLVETKTRAQATIPSEPQRRNGKLQLMCYKHLWESLVADKFPSRKFFDFFSLNPNYVLSEEIRENTAKSGFPAQTLDELVRYYQNTCSMLPPAHDQLLLRYEFQENQALIAEDEFAYDPVWVKDQIKCCLEFWRGEREASYAPEEERWKCKFCNYSSVCPINAKPEESTQS